MVIENTYTEQEILTLLSEIVDPEIPVVTIQEMGMLKKVNLSEEGCEVIITPTYTACPAMGVIEADILTLLNQKGIKNPKVTLVYTPAWTTDDMSEATKAKLVKWGIAAPLHSSCTNWSKPGSERINCPKCNSPKTRMLSRFGSTACKALYSCDDCKEPFEYFKCH